MNKIAFLILSLLLVSGTSAFAQFSMNFGIAYPVYTRSDNAGEAATAIGAGILVGPRYALNLSLSSTISVSLHYELDWNVGLQDIDVISGVGLDSPMTFSHHIELPLLYEHYFGRRENVMVYMGPSIDYCFSSSTSGKYSPDDKITINHFKEGTGYKPFNVMINTGIGFIIDKGYYGKLGVSYGLLNQSMVEGVSIRRLSAGSFITLTF